MRLLYNNAFDPWADMSRFFGPVRSESNWSPAFDIDETDTAFVLRGDIPGLTQKELEVRVEDSVLTVRGERRPAADETRFNRRERPHGKFVRTFRLSEGIDDTEVKAAYENGVLELTLPKREPADTSRLIPVQ